MNEPEAEAVKPRLDSACQIAPAELLLEGHRLFGPGVGIFAATVGSYSAGIRPGKGNGKLIVTLPEALVGARGSYVLRLLGSPADGEPTMTVTLGL